MKTRVYKQQKKEYLVRYIVQKMTLYNRLSHLTASHLMIQSQKDGERGRGRGMVVAEEVVRMWARGRTTKLFGSMWYKWITYTENGRLVVWKGHLHENFYGDLQIRLILIDELGTKMETIVFHRQAEHLN
uniref:Uncharacterized protein n=1 Tax=Oryza nivara TaxID=4536 RepID=A0A0E0HZS2_ORYNI